MSAYDYYPGDVSLADQSCYYGDHDYGMWDHEGRRRKPVSTCRNCYEPNYQLRWYIGYVTRKAREWHVSWVDADKRLEEEAYAEIEA